MNVGDQTINGEPLLACTEELERRGEVEGTEIGRADLPHQGPACRFMVFNDRNGYRIALVLSS